MVGSALAQNTSAAVGNERQVALYERGDFRATRTRDFDLLHTRLEIALDWRHRQVIGQATLKLTPVFYAQELLSLDAKGMEINKVMLLSDDLQDSTLLDYEYDGEQLLIDLGMLAGRGDTLLTFIDYLASPHAYGSGIGDDQIYDFSSVLQYTLLHID